MSLVKKNRLACIIGLALLAGGTHANADMPEWECDGDTITVTWCPSPFDSYTLDTGDGVVIGATDVGLVFQSFSVLTYDYDSSVGVFNFGAGVVPYAPFGTELTLEAYSWNGSCYQLIVSGPGVACVLSAVPWNRAV